jgi:two-component system sensor histidine kinase HydH
MRWPLALQVGIVAVLFAGAAATIWQSGAAVVARERRREAAREVLRTVAERLEDRGRAVLAETLPDNEFDVIGPTGWDTIEGRLGAEARRIVLDDPGVEAGYFVPVPDRPRFMPPFPGVGASGPRPPGLAEDVETQADAAIRKRRALLVVEVFDRDAAMIRTAPIRVAGRVVASSWALVRLEDPLYVERSVQGYKLASWLALGGIALAMLLTINLARTVRRQARERARLQIELRRSERLAALGKLLAGVAHEVRNPLAGIRSTVQLWQRGIGPDDESFAGLVAEVDRLEEIVIRLLQFSRADAQDLEPGDLNAVVAEAARLARPAATEHGVALDLELDDGLPPVLMAPPALLQVFRNLTTNAIQAMPDRGAIVLATRFDPLNSAVLATVTDDGPGLSSETLAHLFEPFFTTKAGGTGLGLAIAREIVLAHRGDLRAQNRQDGPGAVFTLTLPAVAVVPEVRRSQPIPVVAEPQP